MDVDRSGQCPVRCHESPYSVGAVRASAARVGPLGALNGARSSASALPFDGLDVCCCEAPSTSIIIAWPWHQGSLAHHHMPQLLEHKTIDLCGREVLSVVDPRRKRALAHIAGVDAAERCAALETVQKLLIVSERPPSDSFCARCEQAIGVKAEPVRWWPAGLGPGVAGCASSLAPVRVRACGESGYVAWGLAWRRPSPLE